ncbi:MAG: ABC transporter ATP-binding protein [Fusobacteriota bacterium]
MEKEIKAAIEIKDISKSYGEVKALENINLTIEKGEFFGLLGPNGAGKTTLIGILGSLVNRDKGEISVLGNEILKYPKKVKKSLGIVPQEVSLDPFFSVKDTLRIQSGYFGIKKNEEKIEEILQALGLKDKEDVNPRQLSGGMKRRLLIAKALVHDPEIIVLDEPTAGVDIELRNSMWDYVRKLNKEGKTIILTTHYLEEAEELCDRIAILDKGKVVKVDKKENLMDLVDRKRISITYTGDLGKVSGKIISKLKDNEIYNIEVELQKRDIDKFIKDINKKEVEILDMDISSPKLEEVFLKLVTLRGDE